MEKSWARLAICDYARDMPVIAPMGFRHPCRKMRSQTRLLYLIGAALASMYGICHSLEGQPNSPKASNAACCKAERFLVAFVEQVVYPTEDFQVLVQLVAGR